MKETTRARVVAVVSAVYLREDITSVYDNSISDHREIIASAANDEVAGYDHSTESHFTGIDDANKGSLDFFDYHNAKYVHLKLNGSSFDGYDYDTEKHFTGIIEARIVSLYDYETEEYYDYSV
jgi:hypothetical protein